MLLHFLWTHRSGNVGSKNYWCSRDHVSWCQLFWKALLRNYIINTLHKVSNLTLNVYTSFFGGPVVPRVSVAVGERVTVVEERIVGSIGQEPRVIRRCGRRRRRSQRPVSRNRSRGLVRRRTRRRGAHTGTSGYVVGGRGNWGGRGVTRVVATIVGTCTNRSQQLEKYWINSLKQIKYKKGSK